MRHPTPRKTTPKVRDGKVQRKNRTTRSPNVYLGDLPHLEIRRLAPGTGRRHVVSRHDLERFIRLIPDWNELARGLNAIVLTDGRHETEGFHARGVIHLCAWPRDLVVRWTPEHFADHRAVLDRLGVNSSLDAEATAVVCHFSERTARAYVLLHVLLHELGHHHDRITSRRGERPVRGESYAEAYAVRHAETLWGRYRQEFGPPERAAGSRG